MARRCAYFPISQEVLITTPGCIVPNVTRRSRSAAENRLFDADCAIASIVTREYSSVPKGRVIRTLPAAGTQTTKSVRLVLSKGRRKPARARRSVAATTDLARLQTLANAAPR